MEMKSRFWLGIIGSALLFVFYSNDIYANVYPTPATAACSRENWICWHTSADLWNEPRAFQTPFQDHYEKYLTVSHQKKFSIPENKVLSPNKAYWFYRSTPPEDITSKKFTPGNPIIIFNERDYVIQIAPTKDHPGYIVEKINWINEQLLYFEIWWGRVLGTCYIYDVENESFIYKEMINDGGIPFMQYEHLRNKR